MKTTASPLQVDGVDTTDLSLTLSTMPTMTAKALDAISGVIEATEPDPVGLIERVTAYLDAKAQSSAESAQAACADAWLRRRQEWLGRMGKLLTSAEVAALSPSMKTSAAVHKARHDGRLLAVELGARVYFPEFQFRRDGTPAAWVRDLVGALPDSATSLQFLAARRKALKGRSYAEILREEPPKDAGSPAVTRLLSEAKQLAAAEAR